MAKQTVNLGVVPNGVGGDDVRTGFTKVNDNFTELYTPPTQAEAEAGTSQVVKGWTAQRVRQAITAWYTGISGAIGRTILGRGTAAEVRGDLGLGTAATKDVGTVPGHVMEVGAFGLGGANVLSSGVDIDTLRLNGLYGINSGTFPKIPITTGGTLLVTNYGGAAVDRIVQIYFALTNRIFSRSNTGTGWGTWEELYHTGNLLNIGSTQASARSALELGTAATRDVGTSAGNVMQVGAYGLGTSTTVVGFTGDLNNLTTVGFYVTNTSNTTNLPPLFGAYAVIVDYANSGIRFMQTAKFQDSTGLRIFSRKLSASGWTDWVEMYHTGNTTKSPDGTIKASSPVINLYTDKHDLHNESQFGATPAVVRKSKGVYEITGTLGLRSEGWYLDTPSDRNGNKYFNIEWNQNIAPDAVDGVVEYLDGIIVTIETFERVWNKDTGMFDNGAPIDINDLQDRFVQLRFNEIKVEHEELDDEAITRNQE